jgi:uncharacterized protein YbjT (DUF2867 family)
MSAPVAGPTGLIGQHVVAHLLRKGFSARILTHGIHPLP